MMNAEYCRLPIADWKTSRGKPALPDYNWAGPKAEVVANCDPLTLSDIPSAKGAECESLGQRPRLQIIDYFER